MSLLEWLAIAVTILTVYALSQTIGNASRALYSRFRALLGIHGSVECVEFVC